MCAYAGNEGKPVARAAVGRPFHFLELGSGAAAKPASVVFYGGAWPLDHGPAAAEQPAKGPRTIVYAQSLESAHEAPLGSI